MQAAVSAMEKHNDDMGGNVLVTGATSSIRGREGFASFAASKGGLRQICQSVAREYGPKVGLETWPQREQPWLIALPLQHIHVAHIIVDGLIDSQAARDYLGVPKGHRFASDAVRHRTKKSAERRFTADDSSPALPRSFVRRRWQRPGSFSLRSTSRPGRLRWIYGRPGNIFDRRKTQDGSAKHSYERDDDAQSGVCTYLR